MIKYSRGTWMYCHDSWIRQTGGSCWGQQHFPIQRMRSDWLAWESRLIKGRRWQFSTRIVNGVLMTVLSMYIKTSGHLLYSAKRKSSRRSTSELAQLVKSWRHVLQFIHSYMMLQQILFYPLLGSVSLLPIHVLKHNGSMNVHKF